MSGGVQPVIQYNDIVDNGTYAIRNLTEYDIDAKFNWWGESATEEMEGSSGPQMLSIFYSPNHTQVNYSGWLNSSFLAGGTPTASTQTGLLQFTDPTGNVVTSYQHGDEIVLQLTDSDANSEADKRNNINVLVTSTLEDQGSPAQAINLIANSNNTGTGDIQITVVSDEVVAQSYEVLALSNYEFLVTGSDTGVEDERLYIYQSSEYPYFTRDGAISIGISEGW